VYFTPKPWRSIKFIGLYALLVFFLTTTMTVSSISAQGPIGPLGDYGDAPDDLLATYDVSNPDELGTFPSLFTDIGDIDFVFHRFPQDRIFLGPTATLEQNAL